MTQREAYEACKQMAKERAWMATYWALEEDGFCEDTDYLALLAAWETK